jgi:N utilization substance protein B
VSRKKARELALHLIFQQSFQPFDTDEMILERLDSNLMRSISGEKELELYSGKLEESERAYILRTVRGVAQNQETLDRKIAENAKGWRLQRLSRMVMAVLRLALYEIAYAEDVPTGVAINEAVELAKVYDSAEAGAFVNGILGAVARENAQETGTDAQPVQERVSADEGK